MTATFEALRPQLFRLAYGMLGSVSMAEDVVQDAWLRFDAAVGIDNPAAWLRTVTSRIALDQLKAARHHREVYTGPWLPEPLPTDPSDPIELAEALSMATLVVLETLSPAERAAFILREVFDADYAEVAESLSRSEAATRQLVKRARDHIRSRRVRHIADPATHAALLAAVASAASTGDLEGLKALLTEDATYTSDGGGKVTAALNVLRGQDRVARFLIGVLRRRDQHLMALPQSFNGQPGLLVTLEGEPKGAAVFSVVEGRVSAIHQIMNPDKLQHLRHWPGMT